MHDDGYPAHSNFTSGRGPAGGKITVPWFVFGFVGVVLFNSMHLMPQPAGWLALGRPRADQLWGAGAARVNP